MSRARTVADFGAGTISAANVTGLTQGITMTDQWRVNSGISQGTGHSETVINTNLEQCDEGTFGSIGSSMTQSSGVFTFPETGIYLITFVGTYYAIDGNHARYVYTYIKTSTDGGSNWDGFSNPLESVGNSDAGTEFASATAQAMFDVTNTSTHKVRFSFASDLPGLICDGSTGGNMSYMTFIRLGDT